MPRARKPSDDAAMADPNARTFEGRYPKRTKVQGNLGMYFVPAVHLREVMIPLIDREGAYLCEDGDYTKWGDNGKYIVVAERVSKIVGIKPESCYRKIWDICSAEDSPRDNVNADFAEAMFIACGERMEDHEVPRFPANSEGAFEMAHVWADKPEDIPALARALLRFTIGYWASDEVLDPIERERIVTRREEARRRKAELKRRRRDAQAA